MTQDVLREWDRAMRRVVLGIMYPPRKPRPAPQWLVDQLNELPAEALWPGWREAT